MWQGCQFRGESGGSYEEYSHFEFLQEVEWVNEEEFENDREQGGSSTTVIFQSVPTRYWRVYLYDDIVE